MSDANRTADREDRTVFDRLGLLKAGGAAIVGGAAIAGIEAVTAEASTAPDAPAAGALAGTYPNPKIVPLAIGNSAISASAAIAESKLALAADGAWITPCRRSLGPGTYQAKPGLPIATTFYGAAASNYTRSAPFTTVLAVDATHLKVTFTAPDTGVVLVTLNAPVNVSTTSSYIGFALLESSTTLATAQLTNTTAWMRQEAQFRISGLTPGSSHTYTWAWYGNGSTGTISMSSVALFGFSSMVVARCA